MKNSNLNFQRILKVRHNKFRSISIKYLLLIQICFFNLSISSAQVLESQFIDPPQSSRVMTWWHWENGPITKDGITKDLEAMKNAGYGGAIMFSIGHFPLHHGS